MVVTNLRLFWTPLDEELYVNIQKNTEMWKVIFIDLFLTW